MVKVRNLPRTLHFDKPFDKAQDKAQYKAQYKRLGSVGPILLGLDRHIQAKSGDLAIPLEQLWIH